MGDVLAHRGACFLQAAAATDKAQCWGFPPYVLEVDAGVVP